MQEALLNNRKICIICFVSVFVLVVSGIIDCVWYNVYSRETKKEEKMNKTAQMIQECIECSEATAVSVEKMILSAGVSDIVTIALCDKNVYKILKIIDNESNEYYAYLGSCNVVQRIHKDTPDGECIFKIIL